MSDIEKFIEEGINITSEEDFDIFIEEASYWLKKFGLLEYEVFFNHEAVEERANIVYNVEDKIATITLSETWYNVDPTEMRIRKSAYHEVCELLIGAFVLMAMSRQYSETRLIGESHTIIRRLENTQFKDDYAIRFPKKKK